MAVLSRRLRATAASIALALAALACPEPGGPGRYPARGIVEDVQPAEGQVLIDHEDVPGLMPAMTMNFEVPDSEVMAVLRPGQKIDFTIEFTGRSYRVVEVEVRGEVEPGEGWARLGDEMVRARPAPAFELTDQSGETLSLSDLSGKVLLVDFIFTHCPGPCPILTGLHVDVQKRIPEELADRIHFVSISLDPLRDTPEALDAYARARGADLRRWSFLTGDPDRVDAVVKAYGVGSTRKPDGDIDHVVATFLVDGDGQIVRRYLGLEHEPDAMADDLEAAVR